MDWLQFISTAINALAWPIVVISLLMLVRKQLGPLVERIVELKLPGGAGAKFKEHMAASAQEAEEAVFGSSTHAERTIFPDKAFLDLAKHSPSAAILQSWKEFETLLQQIREKLPGMQPTHRFDSVVRRLVDLSLIDHSVEKLYQSLRLARNTAVHAGDAPGIAQGEALEYRDRINTLSNVLRSVLDQLPPRQPLGLAAAE